MKERDEFIEALVSDLSPLSSRAFTYRIVSVAILGIAGAGIMLAATLPFRSGLHEVTPLAFLVKFSFSAAAMVTLVIALGQAARPGVSGERMLRVLAAAFGMMALLALAQLRLSPPTAYGNLILGHSALICPFLIFAFGLPAFLMNFWFLRRSTPTYPKMAGFIAGACAGAIGGWVYSWACVENGFAFITIWYSLGIMVSGVIGALCGPFFLRW